MHKQLIVWAAIFITCMIANLVHTTNTTSFLSQENITMTSFTDGNNSDKNQRILMRDKRTFGGETVPPTTYPFFVLLTMSNNASDGQCGGFIYNESYIITAASCVKELMPEEVTVTAGEELLTEKKDFRQMKNVSTIIIHPGFNELLDNNIALLQLNEPLDVSAPTVEISVLNTNDSFPKVKQVCNLPGFGIVKEGGDFSLILTEVEVTVMKNEDCNRISDKLYQNNVFDFHICAGDTTNGESPCKGDIGGPLVCFTNEEKDFNFVSGISSEIKQCGSTKYPGKYTRVICYLEWLKTGIPKSSCRGRESTLAHSVGESSNSLSLGKSNALLCVLLWVTIVLFNDPTHNDDLLFP